MKKHTATPQPIRCSFCGHGQDEVRKLVAGPVGLHLQRVRRSSATTSSRTRAGATSRGRAGAAAQAARDQDAPRRVRDRPGPGQEDALGRGLQPLQAHRLADAPARGDVELEKSNILLIGPTGTGKTLLAQTLAAPQGALRHRRRHHPDRGRLRRRGRREHPAALLQAAGLQPRERRSTASSTSTRSTRSRARARTRRSPATSRARACSRRC